jgi:hypothetical protein
LGSQTHGTEHPREPMPHWHADKGQPSTWQWS